MVNQNIVFKNPSNSEYFTIELQGTLESCGDSGVTDFTGMELGKICFPEHDKNTIYLTIGRNRLEGKRIELSKPILLLKYEDKDMNENNDSELYSVHATITHKYLFSTRPQHFVDNDLKGRIKI